MKRIAFLVFAVALLAVPPVQAQPQAPEPALKSSKRAFGLSLLLPGLGHRYAQGGSWRGAATAFALADAALWTSLFSAGWQRGNREQSFKTLASGRAGALVEGKGRRFFLNLATYRSSDEYLEIQLRNRAWNQLDYVSERSFQWAWETEEDFLHFRTLREDAETLRRRQTLLIAAMVGNRFFAALTSLRATNRANRSPGLALSFGSPASTDAFPPLQLSLRF